MHAEINQSDLWCTRASSAHSSHIKKRRRSGNEVALSLDLRQTVSHVICTILISYLIVYCPLNTKKCRYFIKKQMRERQCLFMLFVYARN